MAQRKDLLRAARNRWWRAAAVLAVVAVAVTAALGGFGAAKVPPLPTRTAGQHVASGALAITPLKAWVAMRRPGGAVDTTTPQQYLVLQADVVNLTPRSVSAFGHLQEDLILLSETREPIAADTLMMADDHSIVDHLQPRLRTRVDLVWKLAPDAAMPAHRVWGLFARDYKAKAYLNDEGAWMQGAPLLKIDMAVTDQRAADLRAAGAVR